MDYYKKKEETNRCLKQIFPPELKVIIESYNKERCSMERTNQREKST